MHNLQLLKTVNYEKRNAVFGKLLLSLQRKIQKLIIMIKEFTSLYWQSADASGISVTVDTTWSEPINTGF